MPAADRFVIVTGSMRSGTSLLGHLLQRRPAGERAVAGLGFDNDESREVVELFARVREALGPETGYGDPFLDIGSPDALCAALRPHCSVDATEIKRSLREELEAAILRCAPPGPPPTLFGLKRTSMNYEIAFVEALYADVRLIFTVRDPRDVFVSHAVRLKSAQTSGSSLAILAYVLANHYMLARYRAQGRAVLVLRYEDLAAAPLATMQRVVEHMGVAPGDFDFASLASREVPNNSSYGEGGGRGFVSGAGIMRDSVGRFHDVIEPLVGRLVEWLCAPVMAAHGYVPVRAGLAWDADFEPLLEAMRKRCAQAKISYAPVARRLAELGVG